MRFLAAILLLASTSTAALAQTATGPLEYTPPQPPAQIDPGSLLLRLILMLVIVLALCAAVLWFARSLKKARTPQVGPNGRMTHDGTLPLDRRCSVHLLSVDGQSVAVTTDASGLKSVVVLSEPFDKLLQKTATLPVESEEEPALPRS